MNNKCRICNSEKRYDEYRKLYERCGLFNTRHLLKFYYHKRDRILRKSKSYFYKNEEYINEYNIK